MAEEESSVEGEWILFVFRRPHITHIVMARRRLEGGGGCWKRKRGRTWMTSAKFWTLAPLSLSLISQFCSLLVPCPSLPPSKCRRHWSFAPKEGRRNVATPDKKCAPLSLSRNGFVFLSVSRLAHILRLIERSVHAFSINDRPR